MPGYQSDHVSVEMDNAGKKAEREKEDDDSVTCEAVPIEEDKTEIIRSKTSPTTDIRFTHKDTERHGATQGCLACQHVTGCTDIPRGVGHPADCRSRIRDLTRLDEDRRERVERADLRKNKRGDLVGHIRTGYCGQDQSRAAVLCKKLQGPRRITKLQKEMQTQMLKLVPEDIDVVEIHSHPRATTRAEQWGPKGGWSPGLTTKDGLSR